MMANPLKVGYIRGRRLRRKGLENFGERDTSMVRKKVFPGRKISSLDFLGKEGTIRIVRIKEV